jgi:hypothetical protein
VTDTNYHYLTVVSPMQFNNPRQFTMSMVGPDGATASYSVNESPGNSHVFQFMFRGNCTLQANCIGGGFATVQGMFLDDAPITYSSLLPTPSGFHLIVP